MAQLVKHGAKTRLLPNNTAFGKLDEFLRRYSVPISYLLLFQTETPAITAHQSDFAKPLQSAAAEVAAGLVQLTLVELFDHLMKSLHSSQIIQTDRECRTMRDLAVRFVIKELASLPDEFFDAVADQL